ncbi:MAG: hypothetical protein ACRBBS_09140 [Thalassovita sp.]
MRDKGGWFSATSNTWSQDGSYYNAYYAEYGLWDWMTVGVDSGITSAGAISALFFTRVPIWQSDKGHRIAFEVGGGKSAGRPISRTGLSYGRGLTTRFGGGWMAVDALALVDLWSGIASYKVDSTIGLSPSDKWKTILQFQTEVHPGIRHSMKIAPSVVRRLGKNTHFEFGLSEVVLGGRGSAVKLGIWLEF